MERTILRMEVLIHDLLDTSLIELDRFNLHLEECNISELCQHIVHEYSAISNSTPHLVLDMPDAAMYANIDTARMSQVLLNLVSNAQKYSSQDAPIIISVQRINDIGVIAVRDRGIGIPEEHLPHIFERFYRVPEVSVQTGSSVGLGLGLYISRKIIEHHGGNIYVQSTLGEGSTFTITLPLALNEVMQSEAQTATYS